MKNYIVTYFLAGKEQRMVVRAASPEDAESKVLAYLKDSNDWADSLVVDVTEVNCQCQCCLK